MRSSLALALLLASCAPPPEVPDTAVQPDLSEICRDLYAHHPDEDPALLRKQLAWLYVWLDVWEADTRDGYQVDPLTDEVVDALGGEDRATAGMLGVVVGSSSVHGVADATWAMVAVNQEEVHPGTYEDYQRAYLTDLDCFLDRSCDRLALTEDYTANLPFFVTSTNHTMNQYLWLEGEQGTAMIHRAWLPTPPAVNVSWLGVAEQFYLDAFLPWGEGHYRVQTTWLVNTQEDFGEDAVMNMVIGGMQQHSDDLEAWLDAQGS